MNPQITHVTLGVSDLDRAKKFYGEGLGCPIEKDFGVFVYFNLGEGSSALGLYTRDALAQDAGVTPEGSGFSGVTLNYNVASAERVDEVMTQAERAGGTIVRPAQQAQWGGYFGYFADPDGYLWKVASA
jgi:catechol 2,3-dioxygenase-like lactoylglutathione lyase family enzyme